jgi:hypothetical protein
LTKARSPVDCRHDPAYKRRESGARAYADYRAAGRIIMKKALPDSLPARRPQALAALLLRGFL